MPRKNPRSTTASVGLVDELPVGKMKMARVGDRRVVVARTESGTFALDNACPHQGYGLATGSLVGDHITCQWHNWKYCVVDGTCEVGEEDVRSHPTEIRGNEIWVEVTECRLSLPRVIGHTDNLPSSTLAIVHMYQSLICRLLVHAMFQHDSIRKDSPAYF